MLLCMLVNPAAIILELALERGLEIQSFTPHLEVKL